MVLGSLVVFVFGYRYSPIGLHRRHRNGLAPRLFPHLIDPLRDCCDTVPFGERPCGGKPPTETIKGVGGARVGMGEVGRPLSSALETAHQNQDQEHNQYEPESSATIVARAIEGAASDSTESSKQRDNDNDE
jgi:hypothetical protein